MVDDLEQEQPEEQERLSPWKIALAIVAALAIIGVAVALVAPKFLNRGDPAESALAKASLNHVVTAAETFRDDHDNVYEGLTAAKIKESVSETVVDGMPKKGQVGIMDYNSDRLVLLYLGQSSREYKATIKAGVTEFDF